MVGPAITALAVRCGVTSVGGPIVLVGSIVLGELVGHGVKSLCSRYGADNENDESDK